MYLNLFLLQSNAPPLFYVQIVLMVAIVFFLLILPMQRQKKQHQKMLKELQNGNVVLTTGGIVGTIVSLDDDTVVLRVKPDNIKVQVARSAVSNLVPQEVKK